MTSSSGFTTVSAPPRRTVAVGWARIAILSSVCFARTSWKIATTMFVPMTLSDTSASKPRPTNTSASASRNSTSLTNVNVFSMTIER